MSGRTPRPRDTTYRFDAPDGVLTVVPAATTVVGMMYALPQQCMPHAALFFVLFSGHHRVAKQMEINISSVYLVYIHICTYTLSICVCTQQSILHSM